MDALGAFVPGSRASIGAGEIGPLKGLTFAVKDLIDVAGHVTGGGNPDWAAHQTPSAVSAIVVRELLAAGALFAGKTVTDELAFSLEGENAHYGAPVNPRCPDRLPGGSSSGSAVAVAAGLVDFALGTDTGGSVRVPASFCGIYGLRPTHGRLSQEGVVPFAPSFDTVGILASSLNILSRATEVLLPSIRDAAPIARTFLATDALGLMVDEDRLGIEPLRHEFGTASDVEIFAEGVETYLEAYRTLQGFEIATCLGPTIAKIKPRFGDTIAPRFEGALLTNEGDAKRWRAWRGSVSRRLRSLVSPGTCLVLPAAPGIAPRRYLRGDAVASFYSVALALNSVASLSGLPSLTVPWTERDGCPTGLSLVGGMDQEPMLIAFAKQLAERREN